MKTKKTVVKKVKKQKSDCVCFSIYIERDIVKQFDKICQSENLRRSVACARFMRRTVAKYSELKEKNMLPGLDAGGLL